MRAWTTQRLGSQHGNRGAHSTATPEGPVVKAGVCLPTHMHMGAERPGTYIHVATHVLPDIL